MELDFSSQVKEDELIFIFRSLPADHQEAMLAMVRGLYRKQACGQLIEADPPRTVH